MMILFLEKTWFLWWIFAVAAILRWFHGIAAGPELENPETCVEAGKENTQDLGGATFPSAPRGLTLLVRSHPGPPFRRLVRGSITSVTRALNPRV